jgi:hypothetical protein
MCEGDVMADEQFTVYPEALKGYAGQLDRNTGFVGDMRTYLEGPGSQVDGLKYRWPTFGSGSSGSTRGNTTP